MNKNRTKKIISLGLIFILIFVIFTPAVNSMFRTNLNKTSIKNNNLQTKVSENIYSYEKINWWNFDWMYRKKITINHNFVDDDLKNFPVLVNIIDSDLRDDAQDDGDDIVFTKWDSQTKFNHEIELFSGDTGELVAWVNITQVNSSTDTDFYMYYGNPNCGNQENVGGTWDDDFVAVYHCELDGNNDLIDSTSYDNDVPDVGDPEEIIDDSIAGYAFYLDGNDEFAEGIDDEDFDFGFSDFTVQCWVKTNEVPISYNDLLSKYSGGSDGWYLAHYDGPAGSGLIFKAGDGTDQFAVEPNNPSNWNGHWHMSTGIKTSNTLYVYQNTSLGDTSPYNNEEVDCTADFRIGGGIVDNPVAYMDEIRISKVARTFNYVSAVFHNMNHSINFMTIGNEETEPTEDETPPVTTHELDPEAPNGENGWYVSNILILFNVEDSQSDIAYTKYTLDNGSTWITHKGPWPFGVDVGDGEYQLIYYSADVVGNIEYPKGPFFIKIDKTLPEKRFYSFSLILGPLLIAIINLGIVKDDLSGLDRVDFYVNETFHHKVDLSGWPPKLGHLIFWFYFEPRIGDYCTGFVYDKAGNFIEL